MIPNGKLIALVLAFAAVGGLVATGAFTTVSADRSADIRTSGDGSALLQITPGDENGEYVDNGSDTITFDLSGVENASAINLNATTTIEDTIDVTNNGEDAIEFNVTLQGANSNLVTFTTDADADTGDDYTGDDLSQVGNSTTIGSGDTAELDVEFDIGENLSKDEELLSLIEFNAEDING